VLETELPETLTLLASAGALRFDFLANMPPTIADRRPRPGDGRFVTLTARRPVLEQALARVAERQAGLEVLRGVSVTGLISQPRGTTPHITGVRLDSGEQIAAQLVVDATGRRSRLPQWLSAWAPGPSRKRARTPGLPTISEPFAPATGRCRS